MNAKRSNVRSVAWSMINWAIVEGKIKKLTTILPDHVSIEKAISEIEDRHNVTQLITMEAEELENLLIRRIVNILDQSRGKEIKKNKTRLERERKFREKERESRKSGIKLMKVGSLDELKKLGLDPAMMEDLSQKMLDQLFGGRKKKETDEKTAHNL